MDPSVRVELHRELQRIKAYERGPRSTPLQYATAWIALIGGIIILCAAVLLTEMLVVARVTLLLLSLASIFQSLYIIIRFNMSKHLRPIIEALLALDPPGQQTDQQDASHTVSLN
jgi:CHASE3 domain sensor protein